MIRRFWIVAIACACVAGCRGVGTPTGLPQAPGATSAVSSAGGALPDTYINELPEPPVVKSVHGVAQVSLIADTNPATGLPTFVYEGMQAVAPTIEIEPGGTIEVDLTDDLPAQGGMVSDMNLHFHGLTVSPRGNSDDVLDRLAKPGQELHYVVHVPKNESPGLYWYHPHVHGETSYQVGEGGMSGAIVVEGLEKHIPVLAKMTQRLIIVRSTGIGINAPPTGDDEDMDDMGGGSSSKNAMASMSGMSSMGGESANPDGSNKTPCSQKTADHLTTTLNGAYRPIITISPGEKQFFRVINATGHKTLSLNISGEDVSVVAVDGFAYDTYPGNPTTKKELNVIIPPAARAEFVVTGQAKRATFSSFCYNTGPNGDPDRYIFLAGVVPPKHKEAGYYGNAALTAGKPLVPNSYNTALPPPSQKRDVVFSEEQKPHFYINGKSFKITDPPMFVVHTGTVEEWTIHNVTQEIHDFHIHQIHFLVEAIDGVKLQHPYWADSVVLPHRKTVGKHAIPGTLTLLMDFRDPIIRGEFLFHCHILDHEDQGMMAKIEAI